MVGHAAGGSTPGGIRVVAGLATQGIRNPPLCKPERFFCAHEFMWRLHAPCTICGYRTSKEHMYAKSFKYSSAGATCRKRSERGQRVSRGRGLAAAAGLLDAVSLADGAGDSGAAALERAGAGLPLGDRAAA